MAAIIPDAYALHKQLPLSAFHLTPCRELLDFLAQKGSTTQTAAATR
jgi:hypothetical protein